MDGSRFTVYESAAREPLVVLPGLDPADPIEYSSLQIFILDHFDVFQVAYFVLLGATAAFLLVRFIVLPLYKRYVRT